MNQNSSKFLLVNFLTLLRFVLAGLIVFYYKDFTLITWFIITSFLTDAFDGFLARKWKVVSNFGKWFDYGADMSLFLSILTFMLLNSNTFPIWLTVTIALGSTVLALGSSKRAKNYLSPKVWAGLGLFYFGVINIFWVGLISYMAWLSLTTPLSLLIIGLTISGSLFAFSGYSLDIIKWRQKFLKQLN